MKNIKACLTSKSDEWSTPSYLYKTFLDRGFFDPCPRNHKFDGLSIDWQNKTYVNPPYSKISLWVEKALEEIERGVSPIIMLLPARTDTQWFKKLFLNPYCRVTFIEGRLKFNDIGCAPFPSMFVTLDKKFDEYGCFKSINYLTKNELERFEKNYETY